MNYHQTRLSLATYQRQHLNSSSHITSHSTILNTPAIDYKKTLTIKAQTAAKLACMSRIRSNPRTNNGNSTALLTINARMLATSAPGASTWISATAFDSNTTIDNASFRLAIRLRLGLAPFDIMPK